MTLRTDVGSLFIVGIEATALTASEAAWLRLLQPSGVILFRRNIQDAAQVLALLSAISNTCQAPIFRCIDVEGGQVDRLRDLIAPLPSAAAVAAAGSRRLALQHGRLIGEELATLGLNTTFAPVLDLALPASASVMKTRTTAATAQGVIQYAAPFIAGLGSAGVLSCGKHFPGLGGGTLDSHLEMPLIDREWKQLWDEDLLPYRKLHKKLPFIMVSHADYPCVARSHGPASLSQYWITDVLKRKIGYRGLILSDDMEMGGVLSQYSIGEASIAAIEAGTHLLEVCKEPNLILLAYEAVLSQAERSSAFRRKVEREAYHVRKHQQRLLKDDKLPQPATTTQLQALRDRVELLHANVNAARPKASRKNRS